MWSDEKWFDLQQAPNRKNEVMWAPENPHNVVECKRAHGEKIMAWIGIVDGKCLQVHWFEGPVNGTAYLDMLQTVVWPLASRALPSNASPVLVPARRRIPAHHRTSHGVLALQVR